jgi:N6-L-threonylcarbamoyladenine synthase
MKILAIETSCDETGIAIMNRDGTGTITLLGNALASQIDLHAQYGGVFPAMAKRAHAEKFIPLLIEALTQSGMLSPGSISLTKEHEQVVAHVKEKDLVLAENLVSFIQTHAKPSIDAIAVTTGPGLEPALWVGINAARMLALIWNIPFIPINHMEGHVVTALVDRIDEKTFKPSHVSLPVLALLVSGGHTELVLMNEMGIYEKLGQTRDDAVGEAFDKVARMLGLPYPGGPAVSRLAAAFRASGIPQSFELPRPMLHSGNYDFSYSGIKTAVLYTIRDLTNGNTRELTDAEKEMLAAAFEDAAIEVLIKKTIAAAKEYNAATVIVGGGVAGNTYLREKLTEAITKLSGITLQFPEMWLATDNAVMIGLAACLQFSHNKSNAIDPKDAKADGNLSIENK